MVKRNRNYLKIQLEIDMRNHKKGTILKLETDKNGYPYDAFWRRRVKEEKNGLYAGITILYDKEPKKIKKQEGSVNGDNI